MPAETPLSILEALGRGDPVIGRMIRNGQTEGLDQVTSLAHQIDQGQNYSQDAREGARIFLHIAGLP